MLKKLFYFLLFDLLLFVAFVGCTDYTSPDEKIAAEEAAKEIVAEEQEAIRLQEEKELAQMAIKDSIQAIMDSLSAVQ